MTTKKMVDIIKTQESEAWETLQRERWLALLSGMERGCGYFNGSSYADNLCKSYCVAWDTLYQLCETLDIVTEHSSAAGMYAEDFYNYCKG